MKRWFRSPWLWVAVLIAVIPAAGLLFLRQSTINVMHPALDKLSSVSFADRWSHPEMLKIRELGHDALPPLRRVLREKDNPTTRFLLWVKAKWPAAVKHFPFIPDSRKLTERRATACQVMQSLGPAGKPAAPEIIKVLQSRDPGDINAGSMALWAIGIDAGICDQLDAAWEEGASEWGRMQIVSALDAVKPPSARTLRTLTAALADPSPHVQGGAAGTLGHLGVAAPAAVSALKHLQATSTNELLRVTSSAALWKLTGDRTLVLGPVFQVFNAQLGRPLVPIPGGGHGGQAVSAGDQVAMAAAELFPKMGLADPEKAAALALLDSWCGKSGRIFIRMLLLPAMMDLGFPREKCLEVCRTGLDQQEIYYRIQAAQLLSEVSDRYAVTELDLDALVRDQEVGVRVYAARIHWRKNHQPHVVVPVLTEALNRQKHQSYYYDREILPAALTALGDIGPEAREAAKDLELLARDPNPTIAKLASEALTRIRK